MKTKTAHELARELLAGPDLPVKHWNHSIAGRDEEEDGFRDLIVEHDRESGFIVIIAEDCMEELDAELAESRATAAPDMDMERIISEPFMFCHADGIVRVKDGRTIEAYVNSAELIARRLPITGNRPEPTPLLMFPLDTVRLLWEYYRRAEIKAFEDGKTPADGSPANMKRSPYHEETLLRLQACGDELKRTIKEAGDKRPAHAIDAARSLVNEASKLKLHLHAWPAARR